MAHAYTFLAKQLMINTDMMLMNSRVTPESIFDPQGWHSNILLAVCIEDALSFFSTSLNQKRDILYVFVSCASFWQ